MTGTAETEAEEFGTTYNIDVVIIPTNRSMVRVDNSDMIYRTLPEKWDAVVDEIKELHAEGRPVLVGTVSVENSELISERLKSIGIKHNVLNAKYHEREAEIIAQAGRKGAVTIATNMAGRGTDILLGGNPDSLAEEYLKRMEINPDDATPEQLEEQLRKAKSVVADEHKEVVAVGGLHISGHRTARISPYRQSASRTCRTPGRSRFVAVRFVAGRRSDAYFRGRQGPLDDGMARHGKRRGDRIENGFETDRTCPESRRSPQLQNAQTRPQIRRRDEQTARNDLRSASPVDVRTRTSRLSAR